MQLQSPLPITYVQRPLIGVLLSPLTPMKISSQMSPTKVIPLKILGGTGGTGTRNRLSETRSAEPAEPVEPERVERGTEKFKNVAERWNAERKTKIIGGTRNPFLRSAAFQNHLWNIPSGLIFQTSTNLPPDCAKTS